MHASLDGAVGKLSRAYVQVVELQQATSAVFPNIPRPLRAEEQDGGLEYRFYIDDLPSIDREWALSTSEVLFNTRSALDYLVYELHVRRFRGQVTDKIARDSEFPIFTAHQDLGKARHTRHLSKRDQSALRQLQPYITRNDSLHLIRRSLQELSDNHNTDKHRQLRVIAASQGAVTTPDVPQEFGFQQHFDQSQILDNGACVYRWTFASKPPNIEELIRIPESWISPAFIDSTGSPAHLPNTLARYIDAATMVLERFADRFDHVPRPIAWRHPVFGELPGVHGTAKRISHQLFRDE